jgi:hypothetical protein
MVEILQHKLKEHYEHALEAAKRITSARMVALLKHVSPVYDGHFKNAWEVVEDGVQNVAPYAGIIERGARPHGVNKAGQEAIMRWAQKKLGLDEKAAKSVTWVICEKLRNHGQPGLFLVRNNMEKFLGFLKQEFERQLSALGSE